MKPLEEGIETDMPGDFFKLMYFQEKKTDLAPRAPSTSDFRSFPPIPEDLPPKIGRILQFSFCDYTLEEN